MKKAEHIILGAGGAIVAFVAAVASAAAAISFAAAAVAVCLPQTMMLFFARRCPADSAFSLAAGKFSCTILFLAVAARLLAAGEIFAAPFFVGGAAAALMFNVFHIARLVQTEAA